MRRRRDEKCVAFDVETQPGEMSIADLDTPEMFERKRVDTREVYAAFGILGLEGLERAKREREETRRSLTSGRLRALRVECPQCSARPLEPCSPRRVNSVTGDRMFHRSRIEAAVRKFPLRKRAENWPVES